MKPLISIIVPIYKVEKYLKRCIESIIAQTYQNIEIILVDDGSPDNCGKICDLYKKKDKRIKVIHKKNGGLSDARNSGIRIAKGEYIGFVDSDDFIKADMYENMLNAVLNNNTKLAICDFQCVDELGNNIKMEESPIKDYHFNVNDLLPKLVQTGGWFYIVAWNKLYHTSLLNEDFFPKGKYHEDEFVISQLLYKAKEISCISTKEYYYTVQRSGSIMENEIDIKHLDYFYALYNRCKFYEKIKKYNLINDNRTIYFREMEKYFFCLDEDNNPSIKNKLKDIKKMYGQIYGKRFNEKIRWFIFNINPILEYKIFKIKNNIRGKK